MKHAEEIAKRLDYLGGVPTTKPTTIELGTNLEEVIKLDVRQEEEAIALYREITGSPKKKAITPLASSSREFYRTRKTIITSLQHF